MGSSKKDEISKMIERIVRKQRRTIWLRAKPKGLSKRKKISGVRL